MNINVCIFYEYFHIGLPFYNRAVHQIEGVCDLGTACTDPENMRKHYDVRKDRRGGRRRWSMQEFEERRRGLLTTGEWCNMLPRL